MFCPQCGETYQDNWQVCPVDKTDLLKTPLIGKYKIQGVVGVGGMGAVYRAVNPDTGADVAVKVMKSNVSATEQYRLRFQREAEAAGKLKTIHVVQVFDFGTEADRTMYLVMELLDGHSLRDEVMPPPSPMHLARVQMVMNGALKGLAAAHRAGIVHRDLKPDNIFIAERDDLEVPKILDFGIARVRSSKDAELTQTGAMMGTASYMAPEQVRGETDAMGSWTDVYAMGAILYELLTGTPAFAGSTLTEVIQRISDGSYPSLAQARPGLPAKVYDLVARCLSPEPAKRPIDAEAMRKELLDAQLVEPNAPVPPPRLRATIHTTGIPETAAASDATATPAPVPVRRPPASPNVHAKMLEFIGNVRTVDRLLVFFDKIEVAAGAVLFRAGDPSDAIFLVETGELTAELQTSPGGKPKKLGAMGPGSVIGETGIYRAAKRSATVRAIGASTLLRLSGDALKNMQKDAPELMAVFHQFVAGAIADRMISQQTEEPAPAPPRRWPLLVGLGAVAAAGVVVAVVVLGKHDAPAQPPTADAARSASIDAAPIDAAPVDVAIAVAADAPVATHPEMVKIAAGTYTIGGAGTTKDWLPATTVTVEELWLDKRELTRAELETALGDKLPAATRSKLAKDQPTSPARWVTWREASAACTALGKRLPTEAEWEVAARTTPQDPARARLLRKNTEADLTAPATDCSEAGLCDVLGGVSEWVADDFKDRAGHKVVRGASYRDKPGGKLDTIHQRQAVPIGDSDNTIGFRCALSSGGPR